MKREIWFFGAPWCGPCKALERNYLPEIKAACPGQVKEIDVTQAYNIIREHGVRVTPTTIFIVDGREVKRITGAKLPPIAEAIAWLRGEAEI